MSNFKDGFLRPLGHKAILKCLFQYLSSLDKFFIFWHVCSDHTAAKFTTKLFKVLFGSGEPEKVLDILVAQALNGDMLAWAKLGKLLDCHYNLEKEQFWGNIKKYSRDLLCWAAQSTILNDRCLESLVSIGELTRY